MARRDRLTLELRQFLPLWSQDQQAPIAKDSVQYTLEVYFFFPQSFGISQRTWSKDAFYTHSSFLLRWQAPAMTLHQLADPGFPTNPAGLILDALSRPEELSTRGTSQITTFAQMLGTELSDALSLEAQGVERALHLSDLDERRSEVTARIRSLCRDVRAALRTLRRVRLAVRASDAAVERRGYAVLLFAEEYLALRVQTRLADLGALIDAQAALRDGTGTALALRLELLRTLDVIRQRVEREGLTSLSEFAGEYTTYRLSLIKKELQRAVYIKVREQGRDRFYAHSAAMAAAGLAAIWSTFARLPGLELDLTSVNGLAVAAAGVGAYILKDRIKDWTKGKLLQAWRPWDRRYRMRGDAPSVGGLQVLEGDSWEKAGWVAGSSVPVDVERLRKLHRTVRGATTEAEQVLCYRRRLSFMRRTPDAVPSGYGVLAMLRFSVDDIVRRLDDPTQLFAVYNRSEGRFESLSLPKVYHLNVVVAARQHNSNEAAYRRARVILNKEGIVRIEHDP